jgi:hypothetical protein
MRALVKNCLRMRPERLTDPQFLLSTLVAIATMLTILTVAMPLIESDTLSQRMKSVATERERIRARARERLSAHKGKLSLRQQPRWAARHGSVAHLRRVRHVDRTCLSQGRAGDRRPVDTACRGIDADDGGTVVSSRDRRSAYENLGLRTGMGSVRQITTVLIQAERYGTPLGTALRVVAQESRDHRMILAEKKAAALPPKLTVPMILFFLPVLFAVILTPAIIQINHTAR